MTTLNGKALLQHGHSLACRFAGRVGLETAQDLGCEAMVRAVASPAPDGRMEPWLERIFHNLLIDRWRRQKPAPVTIDDLPDLSGENTPEEAALLGERRQLVRRSLARLPRDLRRALFLRYYGGMNDQIAAGHLGVAPATVRTRIHRSLRRLRTVLGGLRVLLPPIFADMGAKAGSLALVPLVVAAVITVPIQPRPTGPSDVLPLAMVHSRAGAQVCGARAEIPRALADATAAPAPEKPRTRPQPKMQRTNPEPAPATPAAVRVFEFGEDDVEGNRADPNGDWIFVPAGVKYDSLIEIPTNFAAAFEKMVEDRL
jgi:RNA polymerase sigma-70 factor (ECF subfamily)